MLKSLMIDRAHHTLLPSLTPRSGNVSFSRDICVLQLGNINKPTGYNATASGLEDIPKKGLVYSGQVSSMLLCCSTTLVSNIFAPPLKRLSLHFMVSVSHHDCHREVALRGCKRMEL